MNTSHPISQPRRHSTIHEFHQGGSSQQPSRFCGWLILVVLLGISNGALFLGHSVAQYAWFQRPNDSIRIGGQTVLTRTATYEARFLIPPGVEVGGFVYLESNADTESKQLRVSPRRIAGFNRPGIGNHPSKGILFNEANLSHGEWHHLAFVSDQDEDRLYLDGRLVAAVPRISDIANSGAQGFVGAALVAGEVFNGFRGYLDYLKLSKVPRYFGAEFPVPTTVGSDSETVLLYNFDDAADSVTVRDSSPLKRDGELGVSFEGATRPSLVAEIVPVTAEFGVDVRLNPRATYLKLQSDSPYNSVAIDLQQLGFRPGDLLRLQRVGDFVPDIQLNPSIGASPFSLSAVFSRTNILAPFGNSHRVIDAIDAGVDVTTVEAQGAPSGNDIPEDFRVDGTGLLVLQIPAGARYLFACPLETQGERRFGDNLDINGNFGIHLEKVNPGSPNLQLSIEQDGGTILLRWDSGQLQRTSTLAPSGDGNWLDVQGASPPQRLNPEGNREFFRLRN